MLITAFIAASKAVVHSVSKQSTTVDVGIKTRASAQQQWAYYTSTTAQILMLVIAYLKSICSKRSVSLYWCMLVCWRVTHYLLRLSQSPPASMSFLASTMPSRTTGMSSWNKPTCSVVRQARMYSVSANDSGCHTMSYPSSMHNANNSSCCWAVHSLLTVQSYRRALMLTSMTCTHLTLVTAHDTSRYSARIVNCMHRIL
jgi:hypothetical protein